MCECLLNSLRRQFSYLSSVHLAATALDPTIKLSFTDNTKPGKRFVSDSSIVKRKLNQLLPESEVDVQVNPVSLQPEPTKKCRLLDFSSVSLDACSTYSSGLDTELHTVLLWSNLGYSRSHPVFSERNTTSLTTSALQLFSIPSSSTPVECFFSKADFVLNQRRTRLNSLQLEQLLFFK